MFIKAPQELIAPKGARIVGRTLTGMVLNMGQRLSRNTLHRLALVSRADPAIELQQSKDDTFASRTSAALLLTSPIKVRIIHLNRTRELCAFQFCRMEQNHPQSLVDPGNGFRIQSQIIGKAVRWLLLIKALKNRNLATQLREAFLLAAEHAFNIAASSLGNFKRTT